MSSAIWFTIFGVLLLGLPFVAVFAIMWGLLGFRKASAIYVWTVLSLAIICYGFRFLELARVAGGN